MTDTSETPSTADVTPEMGAVRDVMAHLVNAFPDPVFVKDERYRILFFNDAFCTMLGRTRDELVGKSDLDLVPAEEARVYWERDDKVFRTGVPDRTRRCSPTPPASATGC